MGDVPPATRGGATTARGHSLADCLLLGGGEQAGAGFAEFPPEILAEVPNPAQHRKLERGSSGGRKTYAFAELTEDGGEPLLIVDEGWVPCSSIR
jgi:hypothetical protein